MYISCVGSSLCLLEFEKLGSWIQVESWNICISGNFLPSSVLHFIVPLAAGLQRYVQTAYATEQKIFQNILFYN